MPVYDSAPESNGIELVFEGRVAVDAGGIGQFGVGFTVGLGKTGSGRDGHFLGDQHPGRLGFTLVVARTLDDQDVIAHIGGLVAADNVAVYRRDQRHGAILDRIVFKSHALLSAVVGFLRAEVDHVVGQRLPIDGELLGIRGGGAIAAIFGNGTPFYLLCG